MVLTLVESYMPSMNANKIDFDESGGLNHKKLKSMKLVEIIKVPS